MAITELFRRIFPERPAQPDAANPAPKSTTEKPDDWSSRSYDDFPEWDFPKQFRFRPVTDFPIARSAQDIAMDSTGKRNAMDSGSYSGSGEPYSIDAGAESQVPDGISTWYARQSFIGYQMCAVMMQHWLIDKACAMPGVDAVRNGYSVNVISNGDAVPDEALDELKRMDKRFGLNSVMSEAVRFMNGFGIRVILFDVQSSDPNYYDKPFNPDGVTPGSYKGIRAIDPYWLVPCLSMEGSSDPTSQHFYDPEFWIVNGRKYHRSHLVILRGPQPADILKPMYIFGGVPLTQRIYERIYCAERTANEAPLLAMSKRTTIMKVDMPKVMAQFGKFVRRIGQWVKFRDNHGIKIIDKAEDVQQIDTSLTDFDSVVMMEYQLVAAIAGVPATKLMGTSPKGFNATGEFEEKSYHEKLESIQVHDCEPILDRHHILAIRSHVCPKLKIQPFEVEVAWNPVDSINKDALAKLNLDKTNAGIQLIQAGVISPEEERFRLKNDKFSGYHNLDAEDEAEDDPGDAEWIAPVKSLVGVMGSAGNDSRIVLDESPARPDVYVLVASLVSRLESLGVDVKNDETAER